MRYKITIEYDGTNYKGWQQQENLKTIQGTIQSAIASFSGEEVILHASGRTDAGVHAIGQVAHFDLTTDKFDTTRVQNAINFYLIDKNIVITNCEKVEKNFHARFSTKYRQYYYVIINRKAPLAINQGYAWHIKKPLDIELMQNAAILLLGNHDFTSFRASDCQARSPIKTLDFITFENYNEKIIMKIRAKSFLYHMVRNIIGTLKLVGTKEMSLSEFQAAFISKNRQNIGPTAPACGLYLEEIGY